MTFPKFHFACSRRRKESRNSRTERDQAKESSGLRGGKQRKRHRAAALQNLAEGAARNPSRQRLGVRQPYAALSSALVVRIVPLLIIFSAAWLPAMAQTSSSTNQTNQISVREQSAAEIRAARINGRRCVCGKVIKIVPEGLIVESGYTALMEPPFTGSWVIPGGALVKRDPKLIERSEPASPCIGTVLLTDFPKRPAVKLYDYVLLQAYPAGEYRYTPVAGVDKQIRKFAGGLDTALKSK